MMEIRIEKSRRRLLLIICEQDALSFPIALGSSPVGHKQCEGDGRTPEGEYYVCTRNDKSKYYLSLGLSYPNPADADSALAAGLISPDQHTSILAAHADRRRPPWDTPLGGFVMIHGGGTDSDWTAGCIALKDTDMDQLFRLCRIGTKVTILP